VLTLFTVLQVKVPFPFKKVWPESSGRVLIGVLHPAEADALPAPVSIAATMTRLASGTKASLRVIKQFLW
jgi:hypothetical protein